MKPTEKGINILKKYESCSLKAYWDVDDWSIGYGHHNSIAYPVKKGDIITGTEADEMLTEDIVNISAQINNLGLTLNQNQFDALFDFVYNLGIGCLIKSNLFKHLKSNSNDFVNIEDHWMRFIMVNGNPNEWLKKRRTDEIKLYKSPLC